MANRTNKYLDGAGLTYLIQKIKTVLNSKQDALTFDSTPTANSTNPVTSGGVKTELDKKKNKPLELIDCFHLLSALDGTSEENPVQLTGQALEQFHILASKVQNHEEITIMDIPAVANSELYENTGEISLGTVLCSTFYISYYLYIHKDGNNYWVTFSQRRWQEELTFDSSPTSGSSNPVESGGVYTALSNKQDTLVSGTSIKTINNVSVLGSGNIDADDVVHGALRGSDFVEGSWTNEGGTWTYSIPLSGGAITPNENKIYVDVVTNKIYRWKGSYVQIGGGDVTEMTNAEVDTMMTN